ncbi:MAG TPA: CoA-binding protein [Elusimicrobiota bacterium]|nr:CoA-binding protein [Elusimicrobiota bacterium]
MRKKTVAVVGASADPSKYGNKAVRAHVKAGYDVYPVNPTAELIEGLKVYRNVLDIPVELDRVSVYLPPEKGVRVLEDIACKGTKELFINPGAESPRLIARARTLGLVVILGCSILSLGEDPQTL